MAEMSRGDMMRRFDEASKDLLKRLASGPLADATPGGLARAVAALAPMGIQEPPEPIDASAVTTIVSHLS
jgi:hypothetical protein